MTSSRPAAAPIGDPRAPFIFSHHFDTTGYPVFHVEMGNGALVQMREHEMPEAVLVHLFDYKKLASRVENEMHGLNFLEVHTHRIDQNGVVHYLINWGDIHWHPVWRSERKEGQFGYPAVFVAYKEMHNLP